MQEEKLEKGLNKTSYRNKKLGDQTLVSAAFKYLIELNESSSKEPTNKKHYSGTHSINSKIHSANTVDLLLDTVHHPGFKQHNASAVIHVLCNWVTTGKVVINDIQDDPRYQKVCKILGIEKQTLDGMDTKTLLDGASKSSSYQILQTESVNRQVENLNTSEMISVRTKVSIS